MRVVATGKVTWIKDSSIGLIRGGSPRRSSRIAAAAAAAPVQPTPLPAHVVDELSEEDVMSLQIDDGVCNSIIRMQTLVRGRVARGHVMKMKSTHVVQAHWRRRLARKARAARSVAPTVAVRPKRKASDVEEEDTTAPNKKSKANDEAGSEEEDVGSFGAYDNNNSGSAFDDNEEGGAVVTPSHRPSESNFGLPHRRTPATDLLISHKRRLAKFQFAQVGRSKENRSRRQGEMKNRSSKARALAVSKKRFQPSKSAARTGEPTRQEKRGLKRSSGSEFANPNNKKQRPLPKSMLEPTRQSLPRKEATTVEDVPLEEDPQLRQTVLHPANNLRPRLADGESCIEPATCQNRQQTVVETMCRALPSSLVCEVASYLPKKVQIDEQQNKVKAIDAISGLILRHDNEICRKATNPISWYGNDWVETDNEDMLQGWNCQVSVPPLRRSSIRLINDHIMWGFAREYCYAAQWSGVDLGPVTLRRKKVEEPEPLHNWSTDPHISAERREELRQINARWTHIYQPGHL